VARCLGAGYAQAIGAVAAATAIAWPMFPLFEPANLMMAYLLAVVVVAARHGRGPSVVASILGVGAFDFFFVPPYLTFAVADTQYLLTFAVMLVVGLVVSGLTTRIRRQAEAARAREERTAALYAMSRELAGTGSVPELVAVAQRHIGAVFDADVAVFEPDADGRPRLDASWHASLGDPKRAVTLPLLGHGGPLGVIGVRSRRRNALATLESMRQLETFVNQTALALERARLAEEAEAARVRAEAERLRNALLTSVSHDLRTPLAAITGAATTLLESGARLEPATRRELVESVRDEAERLNRLVQNLLQMTRLESGALRLRHDWHPLEEVVGAALGRLQTALGDRRITVSLPPDLPLVAIDDVLVEQVLVNLLDNAIKHTPPCSPIRIIATAAARKVTVEVSDHGPGVPKGDEENVFAKFYSATTGGPRGAGLGLAICRGIVEAHGGRIWAQNLPEGGVAFLFTLPAPERPPAAVPADA
jgi:two-component system sensor histidine kinase KdpD